MNAMKVFAQILRYNAKMFEQILRHNVKVFRDAVVETPRSFFAPLIGCWNEVKNRARRQPHHHYENARKRI